MNGCHILVVEDDSELREAIAETFEYEGYKTTAAANAKEALARLSETAFDLVLTDVQMEGMDGYSLMKSIRKSYSDTPVILMTAYAAIEQAIEAIKGGACEYLIKPFEANALFDVVKKHIKPVNEKQELVVINDEMSRSIFLLAKRAAQSDISILINGESGTGKEVLAKFIHRHSLRNERMFLAMNCAAIPENMLEAELFGYEKGAFTGAHHRYLGKFEQAQGGTLLLDEISEMNINLQAKLLRVLQEREIQRLGGKDIIKLDVRVLATSNRDLKKEVEENRFREDLFYRLNVFPLSLSPLRERKEDILPLAEAMLKKHSTGVNTPKHFSENALQKLLQHAWPGNIRELENVIQRALVICVRSEISETDLCFDLIQSSLRSEIPCDTKHFPSLLSDIRQHEQQKILATLEDCRGDRKSTAIKLGISPRTLRYKLSKMREKGIAVPSANYILNASY